MNKFLKFFTNVSIVIFLVALLLVYAFLPDPLGILFNKNGLTVHEISKDIFFYSTLSIFVVIQVFMFLIKRENLRKLNSQRPYFNTWFQGFHLTVNLYIITMLIFIGFANNAINYTYDSIHFLVYLGPLIIILWVVIFPVILILKKS